MADLYLGTLVHIAGSPAQADADDHLTLVRDGALVVEDGRIAYSGGYPDLPDEFASLTPTAWAPYLLPGFVDAHLHFPQSHAIDAYGGGSLMAWLDSAIFPAESRLERRELAEVMALSFVSRRAAAGTTAAMVVGSAFPAAQDALVEAHLKAGLRLVTGRGIQTVGPVSAAALLTSEDDAIALSRAEIERWHGADTDPTVPASRALVQIALVPRFSPSVTPATLRALGELYDEVRADGVYFHTHLNEDASGEIAAVREGFGVERYLDTYDGRMPGGASPSLLGRRSVMAHGVHCRDDELARLAETGTSIAHCPLSQRFLGTGTMPWRRTLEAGVTIALGTDIGAGDKWHIPTVAAGAYRSHVSDERDPVALGPADLLFAATLGGARALDQEEVFGNLDVGKEADFVLVDPRREQSLDLALEGGERSPDAHVAERQELFTLLMGMTEHTIRGTYVRGRRVTPA